VTTASFAEGLGRNPWLMAAGVATLAAAAVHVACIVGGPDWYRALGAGERMAQAAERGSATPALITIVIAAILGLWAAYAFSGAGFVARLPLLRVGLVAITVVLLGRGLVLFFPPLLRRPDLSSGFILWSSLIVLALGLLYAIGTWQAWSQLSKETV
jgi:hypothetical protein